MIYYISNLFVYTIYMQPKTEKRASQELWSCAAKVIAPCFVGGCDIEDMDWVRMAEGARKDIGKSMVSQDNEDLCTMLVAISCADL